MPRTDRAKAEALIREAEAMLAPFERQEKLAQDLARAMSDAQLYVSIIGVRSCVNEFDLLPGFLRFRTCVNPPGLVHVCRAAETSSCDYLGVARYSHAITAELIVGSASLSQEPQKLGFLHNIAWHTAALLKLLGHDSLQCPASSSRSWDTVAAAEERSVRMRILDDVPRRLSLSRETSMIEEADLLWVTKNWKNALKLRNAENSHRFGLALRLFYGWNFTPDVRIALANVWCALDALFGIQTDRPVAKKLISRLASWLNAADEIRMAKLYECRCDAVHGRPMSGEGLEKALRDSCELLRESLVAAIERNQRTLPDWSG